MKILLLAIFALNSMAAFSETITCQYNSPKELLVELKSNKTNWDLSVGANGVVEYTSKGILKSGPTIKDQSVHFESSKHITDPDTSKKVPIWTFILETKGTASLEINSDRVLRKLSKEPHGRTLRCIVK